MVTVKNEKDLLGNARTSKLYAARKILLEVVKKSVGSINPSVAIRKHVRVRENTLKIAKHEFDLSKIGKIVVVGGGKAGGAMAEVIEKMLGDRIVEGIVNIPKGVGYKYRTRKINLVETTHPYPSEVGRKSAEKMISLLSNLRFCDLAICLISGGGSALLPLPVKNVSIEELKETTRLLLKSGATIQEFNAVRKHLSQIKSGQLSKAAYPAKVVGLIISDVVGDNLDVIAGGPTAPDSTTFSDALRVLRKYGISEKVPGNVFEHLKKGVVSEIPDTPKLGEECLRSTLNVIVASNKDAIMAASKVGRFHGLNVSVLTLAMEGEARKIGAWLVNAGRKVARGPTLLLAGGETTVTVKGEGVGGRNQELALSAAIEMSDFRKATIASFSTDGIDGSTDAAGAIADGFTVKRARNLGLNPLAHLKRNDSYSFFQELGDLLITGPTGTNVMDMVGLAII